MNKQEFFGQDNTTFFDFRESISSLLNEGYVIEHQNFQLIPDGCSKQSGSYLIIASKKEENRIELKENNDLFNSIMNVLEIEGAEILIRSYKEIRLVNNDIKECIISIPIENSIERRYVSFKIIKREFEKISNKEEHFAELINEALKQIKK